MANILEIFKHKKFRLNDASELENAQMLSLAPRREGGLLNKLWGVKSSDLIGYSRERQNSLSGTSQGGQSIDFQMGQTVTGLLNDTRLFVAFFFVYES